MATKIYDTDIIYLIDGTEIIIAPLKLKYLREFMDAFKFIDLAANDQEAIVALANCARIAMKQYHPSIQTMEELEDSVDLPTIYKILNIAAGINVNKDNKEESVKDQATKKDSGWDSLDLAAIESEVFLLGAWKDYEDLELSLSMTELFTTIGSKRDLDYQEKKFLAAIQGVDLDKQTNKNSGNEWEQMKARVFSKGGTTDPNDVLSLQGQNAQRAGFGIGMGLDYKKL
jgi:hypothetical protein